MAILVNIANRVSAGVDRQIDWIHMPVPIARDDAEYFRPLGDLVLQQGTELYLGLVHMTDGVDGAKRRMGSAREFVSDFGIATECGFGRRPAKSIESLLQLHADLADY